MGRPAAPQKPGSHFLRGDRLSLDLTSPKVDLEPLPSVDRFRHSLLFAQFQTGQLMPRLTDSPLAHLLLYCLNLSRLYQPYGQGRGDKGAGQGEGEQRRETELVDDNPT